MRTKLILIATILMICSVFTGCGNRVNYKEKEYGFTMFYDSLGKSYNTLEDFITSKNISDNKPLAISQNIRFAVDKDNKLYSYKLVQDPKKNFAADCKLMLPEGIGLKELIAVNFDGTTHTQVLGSDDSLYLLDLEQNKSTKVLENVELIEKARDATNGILGIAILTKEKKLYIYARKGAKKAENNYVLYQPIPDVKSIRIEGNTMFATIGAGVIIKWSEAQGVGSDRENLLFRAAGEIEAGKRRIAK